MKIKKASKFNLLRKNCLAFSVRVYLNWTEDQAANLEVVGSSPTARTILITAPLVADNYQWGTSQGRSHRTRFDRPIVIMAPSLYERQGQNDVSLLQEHR
jgi:hypothetical protein